MIFAMSMIGQDDGLIKQKALLSSADRVEMDKPQRGDMYNTLRTMERVS